MKKVMSKDFPASKKRFEDDSCDLIAGHCPEDCGQEHLQGQGGEVSRALCILMTLR